MRAKLLHLSGPFRGRTITYSGSRLLLGTASDAEVRFPEGDNVSARHAELAFVEEGCSFYLKAIDGDVFVNRRQIDEVILSPEDLIEIGIDGPKMRFRIHTDNCPSCKPIRQMLRDASEMRRTGGLVASSNLVRHDLFTQTTWRRKGGLVLFVLMAVIAAANLVGWITSTRMTKRQQARSLKQVESLKEVLAGVLAQMETFRREQAGHVSIKEVQALRSDLARRAAVVDAMVERNAALKKVLEVYSRGVCLIHGIYTFKMQQEGELLPVTTADGAPLEMEYIGSGFLATAEGHVITNRHVAEPWWNNAVVAPLIEQGLIPKFVELTVGFPDKAPATVDPSTIRLSPDGVDVAVFQVSVKDVPILPLFTGELHATRGERIILLGYPTGLNAMLARAEPELVAEVLSVATNTKELIAELAKRGAISPVITQGALNEVRERRLVYDAETTSGGSGGPVFGPDGSVVGVNFAVTRDFGGSNFGVPIHFARPLLPAPVD